MSLFTISDLHLSTAEGTNKSMEVFGSRWADYTERLRRNWEAVVTDRDTVVIPGDISWALTLPEAASDMHFIDRLPGRKILGKGNHDFWWSTMKKHREFFEKENITSVSFLFNNAYETDDCIVAGTRGWFLEEDDVSTKNNVDFEKLCKREVLRLSASLGEAVKLQQTCDKEIIVFMHFPPFWGGKEVTELLDLTESAGVKKIYFGHIHGAYLTDPVIYHRNTELRLISADYLNFLPKIVL